MAIHSLKTKLNLTLLVSVTLVLALFGAWDIARTATEVRERLRQDAEALLGRLRVGLPRPLWDFAGGTVAEIVRGEMGSPAVGAILIYDAEGKRVAGVGRDAEGRTAEVAQGVAGAAETWTDLAYQDGGADRPVGKAAVYFSDGQVRAAVTTAAVRTLIAVAVLNVTLVLVLGVAVRRILLAPLSRILSDIAAGEGDLTRRVSHSGRDELGRLAGAINRYIDSIHGIAREVSAVSDGLAESSAATGSAVADLGAQLGRQQRDLDALAAALGEMSAAADEIARSTAEAASTVERAGSEVAEGLGQVRAANTSTERLATAVGEAAGVIGQLETEAGAIGGILDVIRGIAAQTNLLALNAAIEAARAGEYGRGFAVVADEVRVLSQRTEHSIGEIEEMIGRLQGGAREAVARMDLGRRQTAESLERATRAGAAFERIRQAIGHTEDMTAKVAAATEEQSTTVAEIERSVSGIREVHGHAVRVSGVTAEQSARLTQSAERLRASVGRLRLSPG